MSLIEQLGGYGKAKKWLDENGADIEWKHLGYYRRELLEYRRQHNVFEVGDLVTYKAHFEGVWREGFGKITDIDSDLEGINIDDNIGVHISEINHVNDEEIEVGNRG